MARYLNTDEYQSMNFHAQLLEQSDLRNKILSDSFIGGHQGLEVSRWKTPYLYNQTGFNSESYKRSLIYNRVEAFDPENPLEM